MEYEVHVAGSEKPKGQRPRLPLRKLPRWLWAVIAGALVVLIFGTPNLHFSDECIVSRYNGECLQRLACHYIGIQGWKRLFPTVDDRSCPRVKMMSVFASDFPPKPDVSGVPLFSQAIRPVGWGEIGGDCNNHDTAPECARVTQFVRSQEYKTIHCIYGPLNADKTGFYNYHFWNGPVPDDFASYAIAGREHPFVVLGTKALEQCPARLEEADALSRASHTLDVKRKSK